MKYNIAVVGATGVVGREIVQYLDSRKFPVGNVVAISSKESFGKSISFGPKKNLSSLSIENYDFKGTDIAFFSAGSQISKQYVPIATACGCIVIDNTSYFRMDKDIPLIIPEVNPEEILKYKNKSIISNPNCTTIQLLMALFPLHLKNNIKRIVLSTYQSVSGAGKKAMDELYEHTKKRFVFNDVAPENFPKSIAFNCIPQIGEFFLDGYSEEEAKIALETQKILGKKVKLTATCVRVPVFIGHAEAANIEFSKEIDIEGIRETLSSAPGIVLDEPENYTTQAEIAHEDGVFVSRIRKDPTLKNTISMWIVTDNLRKGAALNAIQIAELLLQHL